MIYATSEEQGKFDAQADRQSWLSSESLDTQLDYWKQQLAGNLPLLELPTDQPRAASHSYQNAKRSLILPSTLVKALKTLSQQAESTLFMTLLAAFNILLYRYTGQEDILVGSPIAIGSRVEEPEDVEFVNTLVLRTNLANHPTFQELLARVCQMTKTAYRNSDLPFEKIVKALKPEQNLNDYPLFQVMFALTLVDSLPLGDQNSAILDQEQSTGIVSSSKLVNETNTKLDLALVLEETIKGIEGYVEYNANLFEAATIDRLIGHFQTLLEGIVNNPEQRISDLPLLTAAERQTLLLDWNNTQADYPKNACFHQLFEAQVERTPDAVAAVFADQSLTYRELNAQANQLAHYLRTLGVKPDVLVAICVERSLEMLVGFLGVIKAGGAYIPLDPAYPHERRAYKLQDSQTPIILTQERLIKSLPDHDAKMVLLDTDWDVIAQESQENPVNDTTPEHLAYVIYTSGSTGKPKGVMITHQGLVNHSNAIANKYNLKASDRVLQFSSMSFDIIIEELFPSWISGAAVILRPEEIASSLTSFWLFVQQQQVTILNLPTAFWHELVNGLSLTKEPLPTSVRLVIVGGEKASKSTYLTWLQLVGEYPQWLNTYGPTETTVTATVYDPALHPETDKARTEIPIGRPIANAQIYILDQQLQPVPIGMPGELYIGGAGLGRGYLNRPDLTAQKFIPHPFSDQPNARLYKTGDTVRYLPDGNIEFVGRIDFQVKIRGFRIELGEIEAVLEQHPAVQQTVVLAREDIPGHKRLVAYVLPVQDGDTTTTELHSFLKQRLPDYTTRELRSFLYERLPDYMIPAMFVMLDALPMTPNGKVDRRALPAPDVSIDLERAIDLPRHQLDFQLTQIWEEVLGIQPIGIKDNFFDMGGHSLLVMRLITQINEKFSKNLPLATIFQAPTIEQLANLLSQEKDSAPWRSLVTIQPEGSKPPFFCIHEIIGNAIYCQRMARYLPDQPLYGLQPLGLDGKQDPHKRVEDMAAHYINEIKTIQPNGPYFLGGYSFGGFVAFEMAQQLQAQGQQVALLALFDTTTGNYRQRLPLRWLSYQVNQIVRNGFNFIVNKIKVKAQSKWNPTQVQQVQIKASQEWVNADFSEVTKTLDLDTKNSMDRNIEMITKNNLQAMNNYVPQVYPGRVTLFRAILERTTEGWYLDPQLGWGNLVSKGLDVQEVASLHINMFNEPHVKMLAEQLKACLEQTQKR